MKKGNYKLGSWQQDYAQELNNLFNPPATTIIPIEPISDTIYTPPAKTSFPVLSIVIEKTIRSPSFTSADGSISTSDIRTSTETWYSKEMPGGQQYLLSSSNKTAVSKADIDAILQSGKIIKILDYKSQLPYLDIGNVDKTMPVFWDILSGLFYPNQIYQASISNDLQPFIELPNKTIIPDSMLAQNKKPLNINTNYIIFGLVLLVGYFYFRRK